MPRSAVAFVEEFLILDIKACPVIPAIRQDSHISRQYLIAQIGAVDLCIKLGEGLAHRWEKPSHAKIQTDEELEVADGRVSRKVIGVGAEKQIDEIGGLHPDPRCLRTLGVWPSSSYLGHRKACTPFATSAYDRLARVCGVLGYLRVFALCDKAAWSPVKP